MKLLTADEHGLTLINFPRKLIRHADSGKTR
jgi:hypothetical protein